MGQAAGGIVLQQHGGKFPAVYAAAGQICPLVIICAHRSVGLHKAQRLVRGGAEPAIHRAQLVYAAGEGCVRLQGIRGELIDLQGACKAAAVLPHSCRRHIISVFGDSSGHKILLGGVEPIQRLTLAIIDGHSGFISRFFQSHGKSAAPAHFHGKDLPLQGHLLYQALTVQQVQALSADFVHRRAAVLCSDSHLARLQRCMVHGVSLVIQQSDLLARGHQQAAIQVSIATGTVTAVLIELGAAALVLFRLHIGKTPAQAVKGGAVQQHKGRHRRQHQQYYQ